MALGFLRGALVGAGLMYWLDPENGRRRRAMTRQKLVHAADETRHDAGVMARDVSHRSLGVWAAIRRRLQPRGAVDDTVVKERVQAKIGRVASHPGAIQVACRNRRVELAGVILKDEMGRVVRAVKHVPGVEEVVNCLETRDEPGNTPELQGGRPHPDRFDVVDILLHRVWSPAVQVLVGAIGTVLFAHGHRRGGGSGMAQSLAGLALVGRSLANAAFHHFPAVEGGRRGLGLRKTLNVEAPIEEVFALWMRPETFSRFMTHVKEVRHLGEQHYRWKITGPAGTTFEWDAEIVETRPNELIVWRSMDGATVENSGRARFSPNDRGGTRIDLQVSYHPPGGILGHFLATLLGANPKRQMDHDLVRFKSLLEQGKATGRLETVTREEIENHPAT